VHAVDCCTVPDSRLSYFVVHHCSRPSPPCTRKPIRLTLIKPEREVVPGDPHLCELAVHDVGCCAVHDGPLPLHLSHRLPPALEGAQQGALLEPLVGAAQHLARVHAGEHQAQPLAETGAHAEGLEVPPNTGLEKGRKESERGGVEDWKEKEETSKGRGVKKETEKTECKRKRARRRFEREKQRSQGEKKSERGERSRGAG
jgi:hypothetical protein